MKTNVIRELPLSLEAKQRVAELMDNGVIQPPVLAIRAKPRSLRVFLMKVGKFLCLRTTPQERLEAPQPCSFRAAIGGERSYDYAQRLIRDQNRIKLTKG